MLKEQSIEDLIAPLFDSQPDAVVWFSPVFDSKLPGEVIDFATGYCNSAAAKLAGTRAAEAKGTRLLTASFLNETAAKETFRQCLAVWTTGEAVEYTYHRPEDDRYLHVQRSKVMNGILSIIRDRTKEQKAEWQLRKQEQRYKNILDTSKDGIILLEPVKNSGGNIDDFRVVYCNHYAIEVGMLTKDYEGKTLLEILPHLRQSEQFGWHRQAAETGESFRYETTFKTPDGTEYGWFIVTLTKVDNAIVSRFVDITDRKQTEETISGQAAKLDRIINASLNAIFTCEAVRDSAGNIIDLRYTQINEMYKQMIGKDETEVIGKTMLELFPAARPTGAFDAHCRVIESGKAERFQIYYKGDGLDVWFDISSVKLEENSVMVTFADTTREKKAFLEIEQQKALLDNLLQYSPSGISVIEAIRNPQGDVVDFRNILLNQKAAEFTGLEREVLLTKSNVEIDPNFSGSAAHQMLVNTLQTGEACYTDYFLEPTGRWIEGAVSKMDDERLICIITDVTGAREAQEQMKSLVNELKRSNQSLEEFAYAASHDLQEPLRKIHFFAERLKKGLATSTEEENTVLLERMELATLRMKTLIEDLLAYSQVSRSPEQFKWVELADIAEMVVQDFEPVIAETGAVVTLDPLPEIMGDERQLRQLLQNLLSNALKYHRPDGVPQVSIRYYKVKGDDAVLSLFPNTTRKVYHLIEVTDNGIGFDQAYAEKIFQVFTRLHGNSEYKGTGVGLAIVQKVVSNHKGFIVAESSPGNGAAFKVLLPA